MREIYHFDNNLKALNRKRRELENAGFVFECDRRNDKNGRANIMAQEFALKAQGVETCVLVTRKLMDLWSKKPVPENNDCADEAMVS